MNKYNILFNYLIHAYGFRLYPLPIFSINSSEIYPVPPPTCNNIFFLFYSTQNKVYVVYIFIVWDHPVKHDWSTKGHTLKKQKSLTLHPSEVINCQQFLSPRRWCRRPYTAHWKVGLTLCREPQLLWVFVSICPVTTRKHCLSFIILDLWLLWLSSPLMVTKPCRDEVCCKYPIYSWEELELLKTL